MLTSKKLNGLQQFNLFITSVYLPAWYTCPSAASAPRQDLQMLKKLVGYKQLNERVGNAALNTFRRPLRYRGRPYIASSQRGEVGGVSPMMTIDDEGGGGEGWKP
jgi:hypothetical protein